MLSALRLCQGCNPSLRVGRTELKGADGNRLHELGAFTHEPLRRNTFIGLYSGSWHDASNAAYRGSNRHVMETTDNFRIFLWEAGLWTTFLIRSVE